MIECRFGSNHQAFLGRGVRVGHPPPHLCRGALGRSARLEAVIAEQMPDGDTLEPLGEVIEPAAGDDDTRIPRRHVGQQMPGRWRGAQGVATIGASVPS